MRHTEQKIKKNGFPLSGIFAGIAGLLIAGCSDSIDKISVTGESAKPNLVINAKTCITCAQRFCYESCPVRAIDELIIESRIVYVIDAEKCIKCGICIEKCPYGAIDWRP